MIGDVRSYTNDKMIERKCNRSNVLRDGGQDAEFADSATGSVDCFRFTNASRTWAVLHGSRILAREQPISMKRP